MFALCLCIPLGLSAQTSNTSAATYGLFTTDVDLVMSVTDFSDVSAKSLFFVGLNSSAYLDLAYAAKLGTVRLGGTYYGNIFSKAVTNNMSAQSTNILNGDNTISETVVNTSTVVADTTSDYNSGKIFMGFGKLGLSLGFWDTDSKGYSSVTDNSSTTTGTSVYTVDNTPVKTGYLAYGPSLSVGTSLSLGALTLKPALNASVDFVDSDYSSYSNMDYTQLLGSGLATYSTITEASAYNSSVLTYGGKHISISATPSVAASAGKWNFGASYTFDMNIYSNTYTGTDGTTAVTVAGTASSTHAVAYTATGTTTTTTTTNSFSATPRSYMEHDVGLSVGYSESFGDKVSVSASFVPTFTYSQEDTSGSGGSIETEVYTDSVTPSNGYTTVTTHASVSNTVSTTTMSVAPVLIGAVQYKVTPVITINAGAQANFSKFSYSNITTTVPGFWTNSVVTTNADGSTSTTYTSGIANARTESGNLSYSIDDVTLNTGLGASFLLAPGVTIDAKLSTSGVSFLNGTSFTVQLCILK
jgi:hypothetical protein